MNVKKDDPTFVDLGEVKMEATMSAAKGERGFDYRSDIEAKDSVELRINGRLERIPDGDARDPEFLKWCNERGVTAFVTERRGWYGKLSRYIHDAQYIFWVDNTDEFILLTRTQVDEMIKNG